MRRMSQGRIQFPASGLSEYTKRTTCRSIDMQHVLPSRNVCVAYHGMTIPLPAPSLCGVFRKEQKPLVAGSKEIEGGLKDSGFQSQITSPSELSAASPCRVESCGGVDGEGNGQEKDQLTQSGWSGKNDISSCDEMQLPATESETSAANSFSCSPVAPECNHSEVTPRLPLSPSIKVPEGSMPKQAWMSVGRGRALQQVMSQFISPVGRNQAVIHESMHSTTNDEAGAITGSCTVPPTQSPSETGVCDMVIVDSSAGVCDADPDGVEAIEDNMDSSEILSLSSSGVCNASVPDADRVEAAEEDVFASDTHSLPPVPGSMAGSPDTKLDIQCTVAEHVQKCNGGSNPTSVNAVLSQVDEFDVCTTGAQVQTTSDVFTTKIQVQTTSPAGEVRDNPPPSVSTSPTTQAIPPSVRTSPTTQAIPPSVSTSPTTQAIPPSVSTSPTTQTIPPSVSTSPTTQTKPPSVSTSPTTQAIPPSVSTSPITQAIPPSVRTSPTTQAIPPSVSISPTTQAIPPSVSTSPTTRAIPPSVSTSPTTQAIPPSVSTSPTTQAIPPSVSTSPTTQTIPPSVSTSPTTQTKPPSVSTSPTTQAIPPSVSTSPTTQAIPPSVSTSPTTRAIPPSVSTSRTTQAIPPSVSIRPTTQAPTHTLTEKTPTSKRKAKISLAIQFKGVCSPPVEERSCTSTSLGTPCTLNTSNTTPTTAVLLKPQDFTPLIHSLSIPEQQSEVDGIMDKEIVVNSESENRVTECIGDDFEPASITEERDVQSPLTQVSDTEDYGQHLSDCDGLSGAWNKVEERDSPASVEETLHAVQAPQYQSLCAAAGNTVQSCDEDDEAESVGARMGRSSDELEKSIALHQRNIHRNRMELKRLQRKNKATEETLAADLAEQCHEHLSMNEIFQYSTTQERETRMDRVLDLQVQYSIHSQAVKRKSAGYSTILEQGSTAHEHDTLTCMELKLEVEALELEDQLMLAKMESRLLQAKSELLCD